MILWMRIAIEALATAFLTCVAASAQPGEAAVLQKIPIVLPDTVLLPAVLPIQRWHGVPTVTVGLNESPIERAAIATGLNANVVSPDAATRLKLTAAGGRVTVAALDSSAVAGQVEIGRFKASTLDLPKVAFAVVDVPGMLSPHPHPDAPATWLGMPFLSAFQVIIDPASNSVILNKSTTAMPRVRGASIVPLKLKDNRPYVQVTVPGAKPFLALIDTTSPTTVIPTEIADKLKLKPKKVEPISWRDGKPGKVAFVVLPKLAVGKAEWTTAEVVYLTPDSSKDYDRTFAVLGMDFIWKYRVTIDFVHSQVSFAPIEKAVDKAPP